VLSVYNLHGMQFHLADMTHTTHAILIVDQAAGHTSQKLDVPENVTILRFPELNLEDNLWQFMRDTWLSNRIFRTCGNIIEIACNAVWNHACRSTLAYYVISDWAYETYQSMVDINNLPIKNTGSRRSAAIIPFTYCHGLCRNSPLKPERP
jgi:hypothetical protein